MIHVGDIHSGKDFCTEAYDNQIASLWQQFRKPVVYTPGDNEWCDCHKATSLAKPGEGGGFYSSGVLNYIGTSGLTTDPSMCVDYHCGNPIDNLAKIRQLFFSQPGHTLGSGTLNVVSQATAYDPHHPTDAQYVENVMWSQRDIVFVTINVPGGSNNDADVWYGAPATRRRRPMSEPAAPPRTFAGSAQPSPGQPLSTPRELSSSPRRTCGTSTARPRLI